MNHMVRGDFKRNLIDKAAILTMAYTCTQAKTHLTWRPFTPCHRPQFKTNTRETVNPREHPPKSITREARILKVLGSKPNTIEVAEIIKTVRYFPPMATKVTACYPSPTEEVQASLRPIRMTTRSPRQPSRSKELSRSNSKHMLTTVMVILRVQRRLMEISTMIFLYRN